MNTETYGGWLMAWGVAIVPMSTMGYFAFHSDLSPRLGALGIIMGMKFCVLMMLLGRCFWRKHKASNEKLTDHHPR